MKKKYTTPQLIIHGDVQTMTQSTQSAADLAITDVYQWGRGKSWSRQNSWDFKSSWGGSWKDSSWKSGNWQAGS